MDRIIRSSEPNPAEAMPPALLGDAAILPRPRLRVRAEPGALTRPREQATPAPRWAVRTVKGCVAGILLLPLVAPALLAASDPLLGASAETFRMVGSPVAVAVWIAMVVAAHALIGRFPPAERR